MSAKVFIDGSVGTTGLQIKSRLEGRGDIELLSLPEKTRKDAGARAEMLNSCDVAILCLPDDAAVEAVSLIENSNVRVIDASSAHRVSDGWVYGFPELNAGQTEKIANATRVSNVGCYAVASISMLQPLISAGIMPANYPVTLNAVSGYSGGGKKMIAGFEDTSSPEYTDVPYFAYGLSLKHKHVPEIEMHSGLKQRPLFMPAVGRFAQGMMAQLPLQLWNLPGTPTPSDIHGALEKHYSATRFVTVVPMIEASAMGELRPDMLNGTNELRLHVFANEQAGHAVVVAVLDNLGKGASGSAVQNLNIMLGMNEETGL
ncbi:MAG: N-acetyl-gamma-glutamyl-phosphate reductase [Rhodospirillaceae bacterium]|nr:N-acetyl-gamma-glutamyl-phosphate reductase [Rhodospirillaceae bacterium]